MKVGSAISEPCLPPRAPQQPKHVRVPAGAWDTHTHVIGAPPRFPWVSPRNYDPPPASVGDQADHLDALGIDYGVLVQVSVHGTDNRALVAALRARPDRLRGVAVVPPDVTTEELAALDAAGVRGIRLQALTAGGVALDHAESLAERIAPFGWHLQLALPGTMLAGLLPVLGNLPVPMVFDHFGGCDPLEGTAGPGFRALLRHLGAGAYVKLSGAYRLSAPPWDAMTPLAHALIAEAPDQLLWASDWPHVAVTDRALMPATEATLDLLARWTEDATMQHRILVENPPKLYGLPGQRDAKGPK